MLRPSLAFLLKVVSSFHLDKDVILPTFCPSPVSAEEVCLHSLDVHHALSIYMCRTADFRKSDALFVSHGLARRSCKASLSNLSRWIKSAISHAYSLGDQPLLESLPGRSTWGVPASWAIFKGASILNICFAATWAQPHMFMTHCCLHVGGAVSSEFGTAILPSAVSPAV